MTRISRAFWLTSALSAAVYGAAQAQDVTEEAGTNRRGGDYSSFQVRDLRECQRACERDGRCQAYTYYELETKCFLKDRIPGAERTRYQTSGVKERRGEGGGYPGGGGGYGRLSEERGVDYPGGDYSSFRSQELDDCQSACRRDRKCEGYTYYPRDGRCYLKERIGGGKRNDNAVSGVKGGGRPSYPGSGGRLSEENGQDYKGGDYDNFRARDLSACQEECRRENRCVAYTFYFKTGACYLKDRVGDLERNKDTVTGRKRR